MYSFVHLFIYLLIVKKIIIVKKKQNRMFKLSTNVVNKYN